MLDILRTTALEAGDLIMDIYRQAEGIVIDRKADNSPLTEADRVANRHIVDALRLHFPQIPIISEEEKLRPWEDRQHWERCFEVDPLDGTKEFIKRNGEFTVNIALLEKGEPVAGVVYAPALDLTALAEKGSGAELTKKGSSQKLQSRIPAAGEKLAIVASRSHSSPEMEAYLQQFEEPEIRSAGSSLKFLLVARGEAHLYPRLAPTMEWDTSAGQIVLEEAGGEVLLADSQAPLRYNREQLRNPFFIAYAAGMRDWLKNNS